MRKNVHGVRTFVLTLLIIFFCKSSFAQSITTFDGRVELGASLGPMVFLGDLGGNAGRGKYFLKDVNPSVANMAKGLYLNFYPQEWYGVRLAFNQGQVEGADSLIRENGGEEIDRKVRNLQFRSKILEGYAAMELYPTVFFEKYDGLYGKLRPYVLAGVGLFHFNPQGAYTAQDGNIRWVDLQPLKLEGQGMQEYPDKSDYKLLQLEIPVGVGFKFYMHESMYLGMEVLHRKTFTDYIDDVSSRYIDPALFDKYLEPEKAMIAYQMYNRGYGPMTRVADGEIRGNEKNNDTFFSTVLRFGWRIGSPREPQNVRCPRF